MESILTKDQGKLLLLLAEEKLVSDFFYLSGGTALAEFYLHHRLSEDLDFFSEEEADPQAVSALLKKLQKKASIMSVSYEQSFNRNLFLLEMPGGTVKTEFTYFPFQRIEQGKNIGRLAVDSLLDIAVNKMFTIYQKPRARDFIDLFCILKQEGKWNIALLMERAQIKFDHHLDPLQVAAQFVKCEMLKDYPTILVPLPEKKWQDFFMQEATALSKSQLA